MIKNVFKGFTLLVRVILFVLIAALLTPILYFSWRAGQPMELPEFKGLTYYQFMEWRSIAHSDLEVNYQTAHPEVKVKAGVCENTNRVMTFSVGVLQSWWYTFLSLRDDQDRLAMLQENYPVSNELVNWSTFMPSWWLSYEKLVLSLAQYTPHTSVAYCRLQPNIPTPEEFEAWKLGHQLSAVQ